MPIKIIRVPIKRSELVEVAQEGFGDLVKAVVDVEKEIAAVGCELHADGEVLLMEEEKSKRENIWGINIYPKKSESEWIEFNSMINLKPLQANRSRGVENPETRAKIKMVIRKLIID
ncbi:MAG: hypothetical protein HY454_01540 [Parcubacteria group bacterium]|nr:hypothetical protein [Parcubacteria group bacterium]